MTRIKLCGLMETADILTANSLQPDYIGFVFAQGSRRRVSERRAADLKLLLDPQIRAVGVFVDDDPERIADLLQKGIIDAAQLHGKEDNAYIRRLRDLTDRPVFQAFRVGCGSKGSADPEQERQQAQALERAGESEADRILLDSGAGTGSVFDWSLLAKFKRPYFLAGGLTPENVADAVKILSPYGVDVSSGIEKDGRKDPARMAAFTEAVRKAGISCTSGCA